MTFAHTDSDTIDGRLRGNFEAESNYSKPDLFSLATRINKILIPKVVGALPEARRAVLESLLRRIEDYDTENLIDLAVGEIKITRQDNPLLQALNDTQFCVIIRSIKFGLSLKHQRATKEVDWDLALELLTDEGFEAQGDEVSLFDISSIILEDMLFPPDQVEIPKGNGVFADPKFRELNKQLKLLLDSQGLEYFRITGTRTRLEQKSTFRILDYIIWAIPSKKIFIAVCDQNEEATFVFTLNDSIESKQEIVEAAKKLAGCSKSEFAAHVADPSSSVTSVQRLIYSESIIDRLRGVIDSVVPNLVEEGIINNPKYLTITEIIRGRGDNLPSYFPSAVRTIQSAMSKSTPIDLEIIHIGVETYLNIDHIDALYNPNNWSEDNAKWTDPYSGKIYYTTKAFHPTFYCEYMEKRSLLPRPQWVLPNAAQWLGVWSEEEIQTYGARIKTQEYEQNRTQKVRINNKEYLVLVRDGETYLTATSIIDLAFGDIVKAPKAFGEKSISNTNIIEPITLSTRFTCYPLKKCLEELTYEFKASVIVDDGDTIGSVRSHCRAIEKENTNLGNSETYKSLSPVIKTRALKVSIEGGESYEVKIKIKGYSLEDVKALFRSHGHYV